MDSDDLESGVEDSYDRDNRVFTEVVDRGVDIDDFVDQMHEAREKLLAEGRIKTGIYKYNMTGICNRGVAIGVSPSDEALRKYKPEEFKFMAERYLNKFKCCYMLVPDYSETFRFHYHGGILVNDINTLHKITRWFNNKIGRTVTGAIRDVKLYVSYCFKMYQQVDTTTMVAQFKPKHVIHSPLTQYIEDNET